MPKVTGKAFYNNLYFQVLVAIVIGIFLGYLHPNTGAAMKPDRKSVV